MTRLSVIGTGYLGVAHAACLAELGFDVLGLDVDEAKITALAAGRLPFYEPGLPELLDRGLRSGRLRFTTSYRQVADFSSVHFLCVGTPQRPGSYHADTAQLDAAVETLAPLLTRPCLVVGKSTGPVGTAARYAGWLARCAPAGTAVDLAWNPEFLREGHAVSDTLRPDRIVAGVATPRAADVLREIYARPIAEGVPLLVTDLATAELVKTAANAFLATKISFINAMAEICEAAGADVGRLAEALGHDPRIGGASLRPGIGFGGGCLPKDIRALQARATELGAGPAVAFLAEVDAINLRRREAAARLATELAGGQLTGRRVGVLGAAFKAGSDDTRDSPALHIAQDVYDRGATVTVHDPVATARAAVDHPELRYAGSILEAAQDADVLLVLTEWPEFAAADPAEVAAVVAGRNVLDGRGILDAARWRSAGWQYRTLGRPPLGGPAGPAASASAVRVSQAGAAARRALLATPPGG